jgi:predicted nucleic acid-binding protein
MDRVAVTATVYQALRRGDSIPDRDLDTAIQELLPAVNLLRLLGPTFHLAWKELFESLTLMQGYQLARRKGSGWSRHD